MEDLVKYLSSRLISFTNNGMVFTLPELGEGLLISIQEEILKWESSRASSLANSKEEFKTVLQVNDKELKTQCKYYIFPWGDNFYFTPTSKIEPPEFNVINYLGTQSEEELLPFIHLGVHTNYELLHGMHHPHIWVKKALFLSQTSLGICEKDSLAGVLPFYFDCRKKGIKPILGVTVQVSDENYTGYALKLYAKNELGWRNLMIICKYVNVDNVHQKLIFEQTLFSLKLLENLVVVFTPLSDPSKLYLLYENTKLLKDCSLYFQIDTTEYGTESVDKELLDNTKYYLDNYIDIVNPVLIGDSYYLEPEYSLYKKHLGVISEVKSGYDSSNQYYKNSLQHIQILQELIDEDRVFKNGEGKWEFISRCFENTFVIAESCNVELDMSLKLPTYYPLNGKTNKEFFYELLYSKIEERLMDKENIQEYLDRIQTEVEVVEEGGFIDYFLMLMQIYKVKGETG